MCPAIEVTVTTSAEPVAAAPSRSRGSSALVTRFVAMTFASNIHRQSSTSPASTLSRPRAPPALFTSVVSGPPARTSAARRSTASASVRSATTKSHPVSAASAASRSSRRATATTSQPCSRNRRTVAAPMPVLPPVTTAREVMHPSKRGPAEPRVTACVGPRYRAPARVPTVAAMSEHSWHYETEQIHAGAAPDPVTNARATPIYKTTSYVFNSADHARNLFALAEFGNIYNRIQNPTQAVVEERLAALEGGSAALLLASGQAAETYAVLNIAQAGDHIVSSSSIYGGTYNLFKYTLAKLGIETTFVEDQDDPEEWRAAIRPNTQLFFAETIGNPRINILDIRLVADIAHQHDLPLVVDNTIATPYLLRPFEHGADIVVHSATKFLGGHGTVVAGAIVDGGRFPWSRHVDRFPGLTEPDPSYHGASYTAAVGDPLAYIIKARVQLLRDIGAAVSPDTAFALIQGIETLSLRIERHVQNAQQIAEWLEEHEDVASVNYAGLPSSPWYAAANRYAPKGVGAVVSFELKGGVDAGRRFVESLSLFSHLANIGDVRSLVIHPASTTHSQLTPEQQLTTGVTPGLVRLSVGLEHVDDLKADLEAGLRAARSVRATA